MLSETVTSAFLEASITGAGLVLAVYALIVPISDKIFHERANKLNDLLHRFDQEKAKLTAEASDKDFKHLNDLKDEIKTIKVFPRYLGFGILITFIFFVFSVFFSSFQLLSPSENFTYIILVSFVLAIGAFWAVGVLAIFEIYDLMVKDFEEIKKKQNEAKEYKADDFLKELAKKIDDDTRGKR